MQHVVDVLSAHKWKHTCNTPETRCEFTDGGTEKEKGGSLEEAEMKDVQLLFGRDEDGEDQGRVHQVDCRCQML